MRNEFFVLQVYQRADLNKVLMSMSVGPYCDLEQDVDSANWTQGAVVSLVMDENERECEFWKHLPKLRKNKKKRKKLLIERTKRKEKIRKKEKRKEKIRKKRKKEKI